jgi:peroxiredoxin
VRIPGRTARRLCVGTALLALAAGTAACSGSGDTGSNGYITGDGQVTWVEPADRKDVPELSGAALSGEEIDIEDYRGQVVVLNVWASWCPPCRAEADDIAAAAEERPRAEFVGINTRDEESAAEAFVREQAVPYDSLVDEDGSLMLAFYGMLRPDSLPSTIVIDPEGRIAALVLGQVTTSTLVGLVDDARQVA